MKRRLLLLCILSAGLCAASAPPPPTPLLQAESAYDKNDFATAYILFTQALTDPNQDPLQIGNIKSKLTLCKINLDAKHQSIPANSAAPVISRTPHRLPQPNEIRTLDIKDLGNFSYDPEKGGNIPPDVLHLTGLHVRLTGYIVPLLQSEKITDFALVPSIFSCCYGAPPQVQHTIMVHCPRESPATYTPDLVTVEGTLKVEEKREDGFTLSLFEVAAQSITSDPLPKP